MRLEKTREDRWIFTGTVPMPLARKSWPDRYSAVQSANREGYNCYANGKVLPMDDDTFMKCADAIRIAKARAAADGKAYTVWRADVSPDPMYIVRGADSGAPQHPCNVRPVAEYDPDGAEHK